MSELESRRNSLVERQARDIAIKARVAGKYSVDPVPETFKELWDLLPENVQAWANRKMSIHVTSPETPGKITLAAIEVACRISVFMLDHLTDMQGNITSAQE